MKHSNTVIGLRIRYIVGLSAIALLVTASYITMQRVISEQRNFSSLVNLAGHQSGLSSRIAYFVSLMATTTDESEFNMARSQVGRTIHKVKHAHHILRNGDQENGIPKVNSQNLKLIYDDPMVGLDRALLSFLEKSEIAYNSEFQSFSLTSPSYIFLTTYGPHVLEPLLDAAVDEYESIGHASIVKIERFELAIWIAALCILLLEVSFIFIPLEANVRKAFDSLEATISKLKKTRTRLLSAQNLALVGDWELNMDTQTLSWSSQVFEICGVDEANYNPTWENYLNFVHEEDRIRLESAINRVVDTEKANKLEYRILQPGGVERLVYQYIATRVDHSGKRLLTGTMQDITERQELSTRLEKLSEQVPGFIFQLQVNDNEEFSIPYASKGIFETYGITAEQMQESATLLFEVIHSEDLEKIYTGLVNSTDTQKNWNSIYRVYHPQKGYVWLEGHATPNIFSDNSVLWHGYIWDITERKQSEDKIRKLALYDPLTKLANRRLLMDRLFRAMVASLREKWYGAIIMLDLDNFKTLNDTKGHEVGDELLIEVASRLNGSVRESDTVARLGGDEFIIILETLGKDQENAEKRALEIGEKIRAELNRAYHLQNGNITHHGSSSIGVTIFFGKEKTESDLLKHADIAMYDAKDSGRNMVCLYNEAHHEVMTRKSALIFNLQMAMQKNEFQLYLQPQLDTKGNLRSAEALLRWFPHGKDPIPPDLFIPIAESSNMIIPIGEWVIENACNHLQKLQERGVSPYFSIAVNISFRQFRDKDFVSKVRNIIEQKQIRPHQLKFELTETCLMQDVSTVTSILSELRELGILIELDDFGTGYSSLNSLHKLPLNALKLDRSLINNIYDEKSTKPIIKATIAMAKALDLAIIAEGVETKEQAHYLTRKGCDLLQGFLYSRPLPFEKFSTIYAAHSFPEPETVDTFEHYPETALKLQEQVH